MGKKLSWHQNMNRAAKPDRTDRDGIVFDSKTEMLRHEDLKLLQRAGEIRGLQRQAPFALVINGQDVGKYTADFTYDEKQRDNSWLGIVEDVKAIQDQFSKFRIKVFTACHGKPVRIVKKDGRNWIVF